MVYWGAVGNEPHAVPCVLRLTDTKHGMAALRAMFPDGEADAMNFVLFSTSGVHGDYTTIEEAEAKPGEGVTITIVQPRLVVLRYGVVMPITADDFAYLKKLRATSWAIVPQIGAHSSPN